MLSAHILRRCPISGVHFSSQVHLTTFVSSDLLLLLSKIKVFGADDDLQRYLPAVRQSVFW
jgi:hypothetical protein